MDFDDRTGKPRSLDEVEAALKFLDREVVHNPLGKASDGSPILFHYLTIRDVLKVYLKVSRASKVTEEKCKTCEGSQSVTYTSASGDTVAGACPDCVLSVKRG